MKLSFTYLVKQDEMIWDEFCTSLKLLEKNILSKLTCDHQILIFCEGKPAKNAKKLINYLVKNKSLKIIEKMISLKKYVKRSNKDNYIEDFPHATRCELFTPLGYRDMCKFFSIDVFHDNNLKDSDYFIRVDTDSFFLDVRKNFLEDLSSLDCDYAYIEHTNQNEDKAVSVGFGQCLYNYCKLNYKKEFLQSNYFEICTEATLKPQMYYTNFEVVKIKWAKSLEHIDLINHIVKSGGIYNYRWGDNIIRYYSVKLLKAKVKILKGCLYKHSGTYDSRNILRRIIAKIYSKITKRLHSNKYENKVSLIDKSFLGIKN